MKSKKIKLVIIITVMILVALVALILFIGFGELQQEELLKQEIINYSNKDLSTDDFSINIKTSGDYAYVEEAVKKYYKELSDNVKAINYYLKDDKLNNILLSKNLINDRPDFTLSHATVKKNRDKINKSFENINKLCDKKTVKNLIDKDKLDDVDNYYDLYLKLMYTEEDLKNLEKTKKETRLISKNLNKYLDKIDEILNFLQTNDSNIEYSKDNIYFKSDVILKEYKILVSQLENLSDFSSSENNNSNEANRV